jgi:hypothetical protein
MGMGVLLVWSLQNPTETRGAGAFGHYCQKAPFISFSKASTEGLQLTGAPCTPTNTRGL